MSDSKTNILCQAASVWKGLIEYRYIFTYGYKNNLYPINLTFSLKDFPHLAGFQYLKDLSLPKYNPQKIVERILDNKIKFETVKKGTQYEELVKPRLEALVRLKDILEKEFTLYSYMPQMYPFTTMLHADYLISSHSDLTSFIFIIRSTPSKDAKCDCLCCSAFAKGDRDYETNQRSLSLLKKECIHISSDTSTVFFDRIKPFHSV